MGVNIGQVVARVNEKTKAFAGMKLPVKVIIDKATKEFDIEVGTPPTSQLLKKEASIEKGSSNPSEEKVADVLIEQIIKIAKMKESSLLGKTLKERVKEIAGTCNSMGILVEGKKATDTIRDINEGKFDGEIRAEKTELTSEEKARLEEKKKQLAGEMEKRKAELEAKAKEILSSMAGKERGLIKAKLKEAGIPDSMIRELLPVEGAEAGAAGASPAKGAEAGGKKEEGKEKK